MDYILQFIVFYSALRLALYHDKHGLTLIRSARRFIREKLKI